MFHHYNIWILHRCWWRRSVIFFPFQTWGVEAQWAVEFVLKFIVVFKKKKGSASWDEVLNVLFSMSEEISDRGEIKSTYSEFHSHAFTSRQPLSHFSAVSFHFPDMSILTVMCSLECRRPNRTGTPSLIKTTHGKTVEWMPLSVDIGTISDQTPRNGSCCSSSYQVLSLATDSQLQSALHYWYGTAQP